MSAGKEDHKTKLRLCWLNVSVSAGKEDHKTKVRLCWLNVSVSAGKDNHMSYRPDHHPNPNQVGKSSFCIPYLAYT